MTYSLLANPSTSSKGMETLQTCLRSTTACLLIRASALWNASFAGRVRIDFSCLLCLAVMLILLSLSLSLSLYRSLCLSQEAKTDSLSNKDIDSLIAAHVLMIPYRRIVLYQTLRLLSSSN